MLRTLQPLILASLAVGLAAAPVLAQELRGAGAVLEALEAAKPGAAERPVGAAGRLRTELEALRRESAGLAPEEAARRWVGLAERYVKLGVARYQGMGQGEEPLSFAEVMKALPAPPAWNAIAAQLGAASRDRPKKSASDHLLLMLAHLLTGDRVAQWKELVALQAAKVGGPGGGYQLAELFETLAEQSGDPARLAQSVELKISLAAQQGGGVVDLPDLVTLVGRPKAESLLRRALLLPGTQVMIRTGEETRRLARRMALQMVVQLKAPQWELAQSLDAMALFAAMEKRFPRPAAKRPPPSGSLPAAIAGRVRAEMRTSDESPRDQAEIYYVLGLILAGRNPEGLARARRLTSAPDTSMALVGALDALDRVGRTRQVVMFLGTALQSDPTLPFWDLYLEGASRLGETAAVVGRVKVALARPKLPAATRARLGAHLASALLAGDRVEEGVAVLRQLIASGAAAPGYDEYSGRTFAATLARLGHVLNRRNLEDEGLKAMTPAARAGDRRMMGAFGATQKADLLLQFGRYADAETELIGLLKQSAAEGDGAPMAGRSDLLVRLAGLYSRVGRHRDVLELLDKAPNWGAGDLSALVMLKDELETPLGYMAAAALDAYPERVLRSGLERRLDPVRILQATLRQHNAFDPAYELLLKREGTAALRFLDDLAERDRFEERPLLWKGQLLLGLGRFQEAEEAVRAAIAIDPSDGESHHGRRMRVYGVLADIREARGDAAQASLFRGAVRAIRLAERADEVREAGLLDRSIRMYEESLRLFQDAYCIQSRLALQLSERGKFAEAEEHYRRAFELMPDSFGRVETHCFGCEGVFRTRQASSVAERVFTQLVQKTPEKPQVHYLLGYLREEQERYAEALIHYREAVRRDPDYLNAWVHIAGLGRSLALPPADRDAASLALLRLQPASRSALGMVGGENEISDLRALWNTVAARQEREPPAAESLYPLRASQTALDRQLEEQGMSRRLMEQMTRRLERRTEGRSAGEAVAAQKAVAAVIQLLEAGGEMDPDLSFSQ
jgi:tetratricopeptide (TPR) repeat protein